MRERLRAFIKTPARAIFVWWLICFALLGTYNSYRLRAIHRQYHFYAMDAVETARYEIILGMRDLSDLWDRYNLLVDLTSMRQDGFELVTVAKVIGVSHQ